VFHGVISRHRAARFCALLALLAVTGAGTAVGESPAVSTDNESAPADISVGGLNRLRIYLEELKSLRADFRQEVTNQELELVEEASGRVILDKPGRFRWDYLHPYQRVIVADGERVWMYEADLEQVIVRAYDAGLGETPAALLTGDTGILDQFEFQGSESFAGIEWMRLRPRSDASDFESISLGFDDDGLVQISLSDRLGQQTRITLTEIERLENIDAGEFRFDIPAGVDVIGEGEL
jgi:outer membrane lipoprotein carrier protein